MSKDNTKKENNKELIEMAAELFARLFWKQWLHMQESEKSRFTNSRYLTSKCGSCKKLNNQT